MLDDEFNSKPAAPLQESFRAVSRPILTVDVKRYQALLDCADASPAQKEQFLEALWSIVVAFVELGFGVHPLQEVCGQNSAESGDSSRDSSDGVESADCMTNISAGRISARPGPELE